MVKFTFDNDREVISNKYHLQNKPFDPYARMAYHGYDFDDKTGLTDEQICEGLKVVREKTKNLSHPERKARAIEYVLQNTRIDINQSDFFPGIYSLNRLANKVTFNEWYDEVFDGKIPGVKAEMRKMCDSGAAIIWPDFDHVVPDWEGVLSLGFAGLEQRAEKYKEECEKKGLLTYEKRAFYDGIIIEYNAVCDFVKRLCLLAREKAKERAGESGQRAAFVADCLARIACGAPKNSYDAMMTMFIYFIVSECFDSYQVRSLGNGLDGTLLRFYEDDIKNGVFTKEEIKQLLKYFLFQWQAIGNYWGQPLYLGGTDKDGKTKYNQLSRLILDAYDEMRIYNPKIQIKVNENTPDDILNKVLNMVRHGISSFVFMCEPGMINAMMSYGATYDEAREGDIRGCYETGVRANEVCSATGYVNAAKAVEYVFSDGFDKNLDDYFGLRTGEITNGNTPFEKFDDFYSAVLKQWRALIEKTITASLEYEKYMSYVNPSNMYSATIKGSLEKGADAYQCGVKFNNSSVLNCGFATLVDSVMAVKEFVYDKKEVTLQTLKAALEIDWKGYERLRAAIKNSVHKYGNDDKHADIYASAMATFFANQVNNRPNARGGVYKAVMHSAMTFKWEGEKTFATPDGRKKGDENSKNGSPSIGADRNGVTAAVSSAVKIRPYIYSESFCLDLMLHPSACEGDEGLCVMRALVKTYMRGGGMAIQFNVLDIKTLRDAQAHPEKYPALQIRVCGWNVLWNNLSRAEQDAYIARAENARG